MGVDVNDGHFGFSGIKLMIKTLLSQLQSRLGVEPDETHSDLLMLDFEDDISVGLEPAEPDSLTLYAHLGDLPVGAGDAAEQLLAANLLWRDTEGATLSLEPYSRGVYLARSLGASQVSDVQALETALSSFVQLVARWRPVLAGLCAPSGEAGSRDPLPAGLKSLA
jgi:hypothetical protein